jgi:hypothetical protein
MEPHPALGDTLSAAPSANRRLSEIAFSGGFISRYKLHKAAYAEVKATTGLTAQMVCSTIRTVAAPYKSAKSNGHKLDEPASFSGRCIDLEGGSRGRDFRIYPGKGIVSISTVEGHKKLSYRCGDFQCGYLESPDWKIQSAKVVYKRRRKGWRYELHVTVTREESEQRAVFSESIRAVAISRSLPRETTRISSLPGTSSPRRSIAGGSGASSSPKVLAAARGPLTASPDGEHDLSRTSSIAWLKSLCGLLWSRDAAR